MRTKSAALKSAFLSGITFLALCIKTQPAAEASPVLADGALWALGLWALWNLYRALLRLPKALSLYRLWVLSLIFSGVMTLGASFAAMGTAEWVTGNKVQALLYFAGRVPLYYACMRLLLYALASKHSGEKRMSVTPLKTAGALLVCWLPWYICLYPGTVSTDSVSQLKIVLGLTQLSNANPICQTGLVGFFRWLGLTLGGGPDLGVALYCVLQAVLMAWLLGTLLACMWRSAAPKWLARISFAFYALCPIFPVFAFCVGKDTNFAMAVLFLSLEVWRVSHEQTVRPVRMVCMSLAAMLCVVLRNPGVYLAALTLGCLLLWTLKKERRALKLWRAPLCGLLCTGVLFGVLHLAIIPSLDIAPMPATEEYSVPLQQIARVAAGNALKPEQSEAVDGVLELDQLKAAYNGELSDPVKDLWRKDASPEAKKAFWRAWAQVLREQPFTCVSATFHNTYGYLYPGYVSIIKPTLLIGNQATRTANVHGLYDYSVNPLSVPLKAFTETLNRHPLYRLVVSPGLYGWIVLFAAFVLIGRKRGCGWLAAVPALFTLAGCMMSAVNGYFRYAMPLYLCAPLLIWLIAMQEYGK